MATEAKVAGHYRRGQLEERILRAMARMGKDTAHLLAADLAPIDEFHVGGLEATQTVAARLASVLLRGVAGDAGVTPGW